VGCGCLRRVWWTWFPTHRRRSKRFLSVDATYCINSHTILVKSTLYFHVSPRIDIHSSVILSCRLRTFQGQVPWHRSPDIAYIFRVNMPYGIRNPSSDDPESSRTPQGTSFLKNKFSRKEYCSLTGTFSLSSIIPMNHLEHDEEIMHLKTVMFRKWSAGKHGHWISRYLLIIGLYSWCTVSLTV